MERDAQGWMRGGRTIWRASCGRASEEELDELLTTESRRSTPADARQLFRNPFLTGVLIDRLLGLEATAGVLRGPHGGGAPPAHAPDPRAALHPRPLLGRPGPRRARHAAAPDGPPGGGDPPDRTPPCPRGGGEDGDRPQRAARAMLAVLRHDPTPRVIAALLENPRLTEGLLAAAPGLGSRLAGGPRGRRRRVPKWSVRYPIRLALCQNPRTPLDRALMLLPLLKRGDLESVAANLRLQAPAASQGAAARPGRRGTANLTGERGLDTLVRPAADLPVSA